MENKGLRLGCWLFPMLFKHSRVKFWTVGLEKAGGSGLVEVVGGGTHT